MPLAPGTRFGPYEILSLIGAGGMGEVYRARDTRLDRIVALKVSKTAFDPRFEREARAVAALNHPNICTLYDVGPNYLVMELVEGVPIKGPLPAEKAVEYAAQVLDALDAAHKKGFTHRDLKPANILVTRRGIKLVDFGLAKHSAPLKESDAGRTEELTQKGQIVGTLQYMAPEQLQGAEADARSDLFSFSCVLYEMLGGKKAFEGDSAAGIIAAIIKHDPAPLAVAPALERVVRKCLAKDPDERFQTARDLKYNLALAMESRPPAPVARQPKPWRWRIYGLAALLALLLIIGLWPPPEPKTHVTPLTADGRVKQPLLLVSAGRVFYTASFGVYQAEGNGLWSVPTSGGEPRREPVPCSQDSGMLIPNVSYIRQRILILCFSNGPNADLWLAGFDFANPKWIGRYYLMDQDVSISPDLATLLFSRREGLFAKPVDGGAERLLAQVDWGEDPSPTFWHPSGARIVFTRVVNGLLKLWEVRADGTGLRPLLPEFKAEQNFPQWSPDGRRLYFVSGDESYTRGELLSGGDVYVQGSRGWFGWLRQSAPVRLTAGPTRFGIPYEDPADPLAVYAWGAVLQATSMKFNRQTNSWEPYLGGLPADCPAYSPDGQSIAYVSYPDGELWRCRKDGSGKVLLEDGLFTYNPLWSPDGARIAFSAHGRGAAGWTQPFRIYTISANGGKPEPVPGVPGPAFDPAWSPDGKRLAFAPFIAQGSQQQRHVSIVNLETGAVEAVPGSGNLFSVRWSPDGKWLAALTSDTVWPVLYSFTTHQWTELRRGLVGFPRWSKDSRYLYGNADESGESIIRIDIATKKVQSIHRITEFNTTGVISPSVFWTPDDEPVVLKDLSTQQIYRIDRDR